MVDRRRAPRVPVAGTSWRELALLRPGQDVRVINLSSGGALLESSSRMKPGARTELQLSGVPRRGLSGRIDRCHVSGLEPLRYQGAIVFDERLDIRASDKPGSSFSSSSDAENDGNQLPEPGRHAREVGRIHGQSV
jgi:hypothetical protein